MTDLEALEILYDQDRPIEGATTLSNLLWPNHVAHMKTTGSALARSAGAIMHRLNERGASFREEV